MRSKRNSAVTAVLLSSFGNLLEWYDFGLFSLFATQLATLFFPESSNDVALLKIFAIYAIGFFCRPLGALVFGHFGDRRGRAVTLRYALFFVTLPTLFIALLPTYHSIGIFSPLLLVLLRLLQGFSLGGEFTGVIIYLSEIAPPKHRALVVSLAGTIANLGFLIASGIALLLQHFLSSSHYADYGWRIAFVIGAAAGFIIFYCQRRMNETSLFEHLKEKKLTLTSPIRTVLSQHLSKLIFVMCLIMLGAVLYYSCFVYLFTLLKESGINQTQATILQSCCLLSMLLLVPLGGWICDRIGRRLSFLIISFCACLLTLPSLKLLASGNFHYVIIGLAVLTLISAFEQGTTSATVTEQFPTAIRYTGLSLIYNITQAIFGGTAPLIMAWLTYTTYDITAPALYMSIIADITFFCSLCFLQETAGKSLDLAIPIKS